MSRIVSCGPAGAVAAAGAGAGVWACATPSASAAPAPSASSARRGRNLCLFVGACMVELLEGWVARYGTGWPAFCAAHPEPKLKAVFIRRSSTAAYNRGHDPPPVAADRSEEHTSEL